MAYIKQAMIGGGYETEYTSPPDRTPRPPTHDHGHIKQEHSYSMEATDSNTDQGDGNHGDGNHGDGNHGDTEELERNLNTLAITLPLPNSVDYLRQFFGQPQSRETAGGTVNLRSEDTADVKRHVTSADLMDCVLQPDVIKLICEKLKAKTNC